MNNENIMKIKDIIQNPEKHRKFYNVVYGYSAYFIIVIGILDININNYIEGIFKILFAFLICLPISYYYRSE